MDLIEIIRRLQVEKESNNIQPSNVTFSEIMKEVTTSVKSELNGHVKDGTLEFHRTINDISFNIKK